VRTLTGPRSKPLNSKSNSKHLWRALMLRCVLCTPSSAISTAGASASASAIAATATATAAAADAAAIAADTINYHHNL
jgi:hypothetical protein